MNDKSENAYRFAKKNKKQIIERFIGSDVPQNDSPVFLFMAGAPGAGKTEFSRYLITILEEKSLANGIIRIDADEIRELFRDIGYDGKNSDAFKRGCVKGIEILFDRCLKKGYHTLLDGTFASMRVAKRNIEAALKINAIIFLVYIYQDPAVAWGFTKVREKEEGRRIEKDFFIDSFFKSIENVNQIKKEYGEKVEVWLVEQNIEKGVRRVKFNIDDIDNHLEISYNKTDLNNILL